MRNLVKLYSSRGGAPFFVKVIVQCIKEGQKKKREGVRQRSAEQPDLSSEL